MTENDKARLEKIKDKIAQMKARENIIITRDKKQQRKARTRRLIQNGALAEKYLNCADMAPAEFEKLLKIISKIGEVMGIIKNQ